LQFLITISGYEDKIKKGGRGVGKIAYLEGFRETETARYRGKD
jgi:hypothetical protein